MKWFVVTESEGEIDCVLGPMDWAECESHFLAELATIAMTPADELMQHNYDVRICPYV